MEQLSTQSGNSWLLKFSECALALLAMLTIVQMPLQMLPPSFWEKYGKYVNHLLFAQFILPLLIGLTISLIWGERERDGKVNSDLWHARLRGIIRYWLAFSISVYGFAKILKTQLQSPDYMRDMPVGDLDGFALTWFYFGYSYTLAVILGLIQVGGCILLLYRRTTLMGVMILLPVMVNIILINVFYSIAAGAFFNSITYTITLIFLLLVDFDKLKTVFWDLVERLPPVTIGRNWVKHILRLLPIATAFGMIYYFVINSKNDTILKGTWKVESLTRNGQNISSDAWLTDKMAWNRVYFSIWQGCSFSPNPYRY